MSVLGANAWPARAMPCRDGERSWKKKTGERERLFPPLSAFKNNTTRLFPSFLFFELGRAESTEDARRRKEKEQAREEERKTCLLLLRVRWQDRSDQKQNSLEKKRETTKTTTKRRNEKKEKWTRFFKHLTFRAVSAPP